MIKKTTLRISILALALLMLFASVFCVAAASASVIDDSAGIITDQNQVKERFDQTSEKTGWQMILYTTTRGITSNLNDYYNANYYDTHSYDSDALVLVYDIGSNKGTVITHGEAMDYISDQRMSKLGSMLRGYMDQKDYVGGAIAFANQIDEYYDAGIPEGDTFNNISYEEKTNKFLYNLKKRGWLYGLIGIAAGLVFFFVNRSRYKNMGKSGTYDLDANSNVNLDDVEDTFITQHTTVRTIQKDSDSGSGGSSGGGSTHGGGDF